ncbi:MAG: Crp/Fnr family transcriptional regulator [Ignavibacteria bacterium]|nr:Crp/Fnr family transcriptional regulator [Ignavibacteria bacterium]
MSAFSINDLHDVFPFFTREEELRELYDSAIYKVVPSRTLLIREGQYLNSLPLVLNGSIRVFRQYEDREVLLYYVQRGETCIMSLTACFFSAPSQSQAITETETEILLVPTDKIFEWQKKFPAWNEFTLGTFKCRYEELLSAFSDVVFQDIETRLKTYLREYSLKYRTKKVPLTHELIARELGTTRVVISRLLKGMETAGKIKQRRGMIILQ